MTARPGALGAVLDGIDWHEQETAALHPIGTRHGYRAEVAGLARDVFQLRATYDAAERDMFAYIDTDRAWGCRSGVRRVLAPKQTHPAPSEGGPIPVTLVGPRTLRIDVAEDVSYTVSA